MAFPERVETDFTEIGGGKASTSTAESLNEEFGPKLKEHMQMQCRGEHSVKDDDSMGITEETSIVLEDVDGGKDIPVEVGMCRICLEELHEGAHNFKLECHCKGQLELAHQECAVKWFTIKGDRTCEVCKEEVRNLPVTILRNQSPPATQPQHRDWKEDAMLFMLSILAYLCFLEQLLVAKMGIGAIKISLPFSCLLGLLSSITSSIMVKSRFIWVYASFQFALVVLFEHIFYSMYNVKPVKSILLATASGFGLTMSGSSVIAEYLNWRRRWQLMAQAAQQPQVVNAPGSE